MKKIYYEKYRLLRLWHGIKRRCYNEKDISYRYYGFKGIIICDEWHNFNVFKNWALDNRYTDKKVIHRKNKKKPYSPENCIWVTKKRHTKIHNKPKNTKFRDIWSLSIEEKEKALMSYSEQNNVDINTIKLKENLRLRFLAYKIYRQKWREEYLSMFKKSKKIS